MLSANTHKKKVLFAPLNWGLGHASRIIPLINKYENEGWEIILASDGMALRFLQETFPEKKCIDTQSKPLFYSKHALLIAHLWHILPAFFKNIHKDSDFVNRIVKEENIDLIVSDNRYGFRSSKVKSIIISHQLHLAFPTIFKWSQKIVQNRINRWLNQFDECWVIDNKQHQLAGELSNTSYLKIPYQFIGLQSHLEIKEMQKDIDFLIVLSGLEPQRSILETLILESFKDYSGEVIIVGGNNKNKVLSNHIRYIPLANSTNLNTLINRAKCVVSRSGFSSIMDLIKLNKKAILIPTPKQPEQEYLAQLHSENPLFTIAENNISSLKSKIYNC